MKDLAGLLRVVYDVTGIQLSETRSAISTKLIGAAGSVFDQLGTEFVNQRGAAACIVRTTGRSHGSAECDSAAATRSRAGISPRYRDGNARRLLDTERARVTVGYRDDHRRDGRCRDVRFFRCNRDGNRRSFGRRDFRRFGRYLYGRLSYRGLTTTAAAATTARLDSFCRRRADRNVALHDLRGCAHCGCKRLSVVAGQSLRQRVDGVVDRLYFCWRQSFPARAHAHCIGRVFQPEQSALPLRPEFGRNAEAAGRQ